MNRSIAINLFRPTSRFSEQELSLFRKLRVYSAITLFVMIVISVFVGISYMAGANQFARLEEERLFLAKSISAQAKKEVFLLSFQERIPVAQQIMNNQYRFDRIFDALIEIASPSSMQTISFNKENNDEMTVTITADSLKEVQGVVDRVLKKKQERIIHNPFIQSLSVGSNGDVELVLRFRPIF